MIHLVSPFVTGPSCSQKCRGIDICNGIFCHLAMGLD